MKLEQKIKEVKKKVIEKAVDKGLEYVAKPVKEVIQNVEKRLNNPTDETINAVGELTTAQQLLSVAKKYGKEAGYNALKKGENMDTTQSDTKIDRPRVWDVDKKFREIIKHSYFCAGKILAGDTMSLIQLQ